ncbi:MULTISPECIES: hypothetical protein [unclassified Streptomyces]|uniref:hypothetical protein n=1 Tax=unclassified Streptomyces TaxID=2593676 RepID=UPI0035E0D120
MRPLPEVPSAAAPADGEQAGAALVEHYPRLVRLGYLVLPPSPGSHRRVLRAHALAQRCLLAGHAAGHGTPGGVPPPRRPGEAAAVDPAYADARRRVLRAALEAGRSRRRSVGVRLPPLLPTVWGLRLFPHSGGADGLALESALTSLSGPGRAALALRGLERLADAEVRRVLAGAGVADPHAALAEADGVPGPGALLDSPEFDPCSLQARPPDLLRRRRRARAVLTAVAALLVCGALLGPADGGWGRAVTAGPEHFPGDAGQLLDPAGLRRVSGTFWQRSSRTDFTSWPTRGDRAGDTALLRRALAAWARPGAGVRTSATPGTPVGPPAGPPQLLYAGGADRAAVVLLHDGLRIVRYAEPRRGGPDGDVVLDFARVDGADAAAAGAVVVERAGDRVRYLVAPWASGVRARDLLAPGGAPRPLPRTADGTVTAPAGPATTRACRAWSAVEIRDGSAARLLTDLGELVPARLTSGPPTAPHDVSGRAERDAWARTACLLPALRSHGVRSVNSWQYAEQPLPEGDGSARWLCTRAETWRGTGSRVLAQFQAPSAPSVATGGPPGAVAARAEDSPACGARDPRVLAGVLWKSQAGHWYVLAAGSGQFTSLATSGGVTGRSRGRLLAVPAGAGDRARLTGTLADGSRVGAL